MVKIQNEATDLRIGYCLEPHDLAASKLAAGREKDWPFVGTMLQYKIIDGATLQERIGMLPMTNDLKDGLKTWVSTKAPASAE